MTSNINHQWRLAVRPNGLIKESDFKWVENPIPEPEEGNVLIRNIYLSLDPASRGWVTDRKSYVPPVAIDEVMRAGGIGRIEKSNHPNFREGDIVQGMLGWQEYSVVDGRALTKLPNDSAVPLTAYLGLFGYIGLTAYFGLLDVGKPKQGETLVVSGTGQVQSVRWSVKSAKSKVVVL